MQALLKDIRYGIRSLLRQPGFTVVAVITLALGIGANSAVFSVVNVVILRPLPFKTPDQLVMVWETSAELAKSRQSLGQKLGSYPDTSGNCSTSVPGFFDWRDQTRVFEDVAAYNALTRRLALTGEGEPEEAIGVEVSPNFFSLLGTQAALGRTFTTDNDEGSNGDVVVLSYGLWQRRFGADPNIVGKKIAMSGKSYAIVGIAPSSFRYPRREDVWIPLARATDEDLHDRKSRYLDVIARLKPGVSLEQAQAELQTLASRQVQDYPPQRLYMSLLGVFGAIPLSLAAVGLYGVVNFSATQRTREIGIRMALGAKAADVLGLFLKQGMFLNIIGSAIGLIASFALTRTLASLLFEISPTDPLTFVVVALFLGAVSFAACYIPARRATKVDPLVALRYE